MGGYGRTRLSELVLGGVTRHVLQTAAELPILLSHRGAPLCADVARSCSFDPEHCGGGIAGQASGVPAEVYEFLHMRLRRARSHCVFVALVYWLISPAPATKRTAPPHLQRPASSYVRPPDRGSAPAAPDAAPASSSAGATRMGRRSPSSGSVTSAGAGVRRAIRGSRGARPPPARCRRGAGRCRQVAEDRARSAGRSPVVARIVWRTSPAGRAKRRRAPRPERGS